MDNLTVLHKNDTLSDYSENNDLTAVKISFRPACHVTLCVICGDFDAGSDILFHIHPIIIGRPCFH